MTDWACSIKHSAFEQEEEWRIITNPNGATLVGAGTENYEGVFVRPFASLRDFGTTVPETIAFN
jgi:hypothetical protein